MTTIIITYKDIRLHNNAFKIVLALFNILWFCCLKQTVLIYKQYCLRNHKNTFIFHSLQILTLQTPSSQPKNHKILHLDIVSTLPCILLAAVVLWRLCHVKHKGLNEQRHIAAIAGGVFFFLIVTFVPYGDDIFRLYSLIFLYGWCASALLACMFHRYKTVAVGITALVLWLTYICFAVPAWHAFLA